MSAVPLLVALAVVTACGSSEPAAGAASPSPDASAPQPATVDLDEASTMTIAEVLRSNEHVSRYRTVVERTETPIAESILAVWDWPAGQMGADRDGVTVFVPTDAAFEALDPAVLATIDDPDVDNDLLYSLFGHHYVHRLYPSDEFEAGDQGTWRASASGPVQLGLDPLTWGGHRIVQTDIRTTNGIIHVIDGVVVPDVLADAAGSDP